MKLKNYKLGSSYSFTVLLDKQGFLTPLPSFSFISLFAVLWLYGIKLELQQMSFCECPSVGYGAGRENGRERINKIQVLKRNGEMVSPKEN